MEGLKKLKKEQRIIELMQSPGIIDSSNQNPQSHHFLANFTLFLTQPCNELDVDAKCQLISEHVTKFFDRFQLHFLMKRCNQLVKKVMRNIRNDIPPDDKADLIPPPNDFQEAALVALDSTLEDFFRSYFMFHQMDIHQPWSIVRYLLILSLTESYIYQLDSLNEKLQLPIYGLPISDRESVRVSKAEQEWEAKTLKMLNKDPFRPLVLLLVHHGLLTERIKEELRSGVEYWALEKKLCSPLSKDEITIGDVMRVVHLKSFDYRVLNLLLYELQGEKDDVLENNFNILRMFVRIYGVSGAPYKLAKCIAEAEEKYEKLLPSLDPELSMNYQKRCEEATKEGGKTSGPSLGTWYIFQP